MKHKQGLGNGVACFRTRGKADLERVLPGGVSLDSCIRIRSENP